MFVYFKERDPSKYLINVDKFRLQLKSYVLNNLGFKKNSP